MAEVVSKVDVAVAAVLTELVVVIVAEVVTSVIGVDVPEVVPEVVAVFVAVNVTVDVNGVGVLLQLLSLMHSVPTVVSVQLSLVLSRSISLDLISSSFFSLLFPS